MFCNIEGHTMRDCAALKQQQRARKEVRRLARAGVRPPSALKRRKRLRLPLRSKYTLDSITGGMTSKERAKLLAFAVKRSLLQVTTWADQARVTAHTVEATRKAVARHHHAGNAEKH